MSLAFGVIVGLTVLALTTLFGLAFLIGGLLIGTLSFVGYVIAGSVGAAFGCAAGALLVLQVALPSSAKEPEKNEPRD